MEGMKQYQKSKVRLLKLVLNCNTIFFFLIIPKVVSSKGFVGGTYYDYLIMKHPSCTIFTSSNGPHGSYNLKLLFHYIVLLIV